MQSYSNGTVDYFVGEKVADIKFRMDERKAEMATAGHSVTHRGKIGRNAPCPCGSGRKFKKCCISRAERVGIWHRS